MTHDINPYAGRALRAGVIGVGYLGRFHAQKFNKIAGVELAVVVDNDAARARMVGEELGVPYSTDYRDVLADLDLVSVVVPTPYHYKVASHCLAAGVHVLLEKPITVTVEEADELVTLAEQNNMVLQVGHLKRFHPAVVALKQSGLLKKSPRFIQAQRLAPFKSRALDVDVVLDLMIHDVDLILNFMDAEVASVEAIGAPVLTSHIDMANARLHFTNGSIADITASRVARNAVRQIRMFQDDAYIKLDFITKGIRISKRVEGNMQLDGVTVPAMVEEQLPIQDYDTLEAEVSAFCAAVAGGTPPLVSGRDGRKALEVVERIRQSIFGRNASQ
ncbi:oxidoreductase domain protein [Magnetococcus marinus MC-1]|uniref:Oxidoreductase domain protein n=1 Tax=Magnetococcus marinus (strain ATCC BAA-1437 / JCM 17883 / MC-1) TaxID=156889 RepID=A0L8R8_MAGMM|nr:Gfo/Idh/MocA family oxidoreductase [Magnetococcus marinus]ABK44361.1 oxidoreductase domain protein [Magnetococcus marinus MC-1]